MKTKKTKKTKKTTKTIGLVFNLQKFSHMT